MTNKDRAERLIGVRDWEGLARMLGSLSNMEFRQMERVMREEVLAELENGLFWETLLHVIMFKRAAFLSGAAAVEHLAKEGTLDFGVESVGRLYEYLKENNAESVVKICNIMLPAMRTAEQVIPMMRPLTWKILTTTLTMKIGKTRTTSSSA